MLKSQQLALPIYSDYEIDGEHLHQSKDSSSCVQLPFPTLTTYVFLRFKYLDNTGTEIGGSLPIPKSSVKVYTSFPFVLITHLVDTVLRVSKAQVS